MCVSLTGVDTSPESGLWSTERGVPVTLNSEPWEEWDLGKLPVSVFTPEELRKGGEKIKKRDNNYPIFHPCLKWSCSLVM